jgi:large subunit ribosomal protein L10
LAITKEKKQQWIQEYVDLLENSQAVVFVYARGISVNEVTQLRRKVRETGATYLVVKNTLFKRALTQVEKPVPGFLSGPVCVAFCTEDIAPTVKAINEFDDSVGDREFEVIGGIVGSDIVDAKSAKALASLPSREILFAQLLSGIHAPATQLAGVIASGIRQVVNVLQARVDQLKEQETAA